MIYPPLSLVTHTITHTHTHTHTQYSKRQPPTSSSDVESEQEILENAKEIKQSELLESLIPVLRTESSYDDDAPSTMVVFGSRSGMTSLRILEAVRRI